MDRVHISIECFDSLLMSSIVFVTLSTREHAFEADVRREALRASRVGEGT